MLGGSLRTPSLVDVATVSEGPDHKAAMPQMGRSLTVAVLKEAEGLPAECVMDPAMDAARRHR